MHGARLRRCAGRGDRRGPARAAAGAPAHSVASTSPSTSAEQPARRYRRDRRPAAASAPPTTGGLPFVFRPCSDRAAGTSTAEAPAAGLWMGRGRCGQLRAEPGCGGGRARPRGVCWTAHLDNEVTSRVRAPVRTPAPGPTLRNGVRAVPRPTAGGSSPARGPRVRAPARRQGGAADRRAATTVRAARRAAPDREVNTGHGRRHHEAAARERRALRAPDPALEPEDEALHLHRAQRHLHHRPAADAVLHRPRLRVRQGDRRARRHRSCSSAPRSRRRRPSPRRPAGSACRTSTSAGWAACSPTSRPCTSASSASRSWSRWSRRGASRVAPRRRSSCSPARRTSWRRPSAASATWPRCRARCGSSTPRRSTSPSARPASWASRSWRSSTPTATRTRSTTRSRATTTRSAPPRCSPR